jgi:DNA-directed RNA polymerase specialized sigma24 family protein
MSSNRGDQFHPQDRHAHDFPTTRWSLVARAGNAPASSGDADAAAGADEASRREALGVLLTRYLPALRSHLLRKGIRAHRVDDLLQGFIADRVIGGDLLAAADRGRGRFRAFLVTSLNNFAANCLREETAAKRAPKGRAVVSLASPELASKTGDHSSADAFDVDWAREVLAEALLGGGGGEATADAARQPPARAAGGIGVDPAQGAQEGTERTLSNGGGVVRRRPPLPGQRAAVGRPGAGGLSHAQVPPPQSRTGTRRAHGTR